MRFRVRIFLSILLPAGGLVALAVAAALVEISRSSDRAAHEELQRTSAAVRGAISRQAGYLEKFNSFLGRPRFEALLGSAAQTGNMALLGTDVDYELKTLDFKPDFMSLRGKKGEPFLRRSTLHTCVPACRHPMEGEIHEGLHAVADVDGAPFIITGVEHDTGTMAYGFDLRKELADLASSFMVEVAAVEGRRVLFTSLAGWTPEQGGEDHVWVGGRHFLAESARPERSRVMFVILRSMSTADEQKRMTLWFGAGALGLALGIAAIVSAGVARGLSRPVETLVEATQKVGGGDYGVKVKVAGAGELARLGTAFNSMTASLQKRREIMEKTLSRDVADELMENVELGGERREVSILFMDVRGFTSGTEGVDPVTVVGMLNDMMDRLAAAIEANGGNVNKYLGDGIMAMFGAPKPLEDHPYKAALAAVEMQKQMAEWGAEREAKGLPSFKVGVGVNTGTAVGGRVGSQQRLEYTLIGEQVNLASRVCGKASPGQVLVTRATFDKLGGRLKTRELEPIQVKGLSYPVSVYEVTA